MVCYVFDVETDVFIAIVISKNAIFAPENTNSVRNNALNRL